ncbi:ABC transporter permease [Amycolatopsis ultiminotia]|uniref:ABC transporter permease n=1 Tax=Amycolatopsis ultiminotia TaxID=543629 RepID=A0ABP6XIG8_9PSEU
MNAVARAAKAVAGGIGVVWGAATLAFFALHLVPGDTADILMGTQALTSPQVHRRITAELGLDEPLWSQYLRFLGHLMHGDLGRSYQLRQPVWTLLGQNAWPTVSLGLAALVLALVVGTASAIATAGRRPAWRAAASAWELTAVSTPSFWLGILLLTVFSFRLHWFPVAGRNGITALVLPAGTLGLPLAGTIAQVVRESLETTLHQPFMTTARARGLGGMALRLRHALRHGASSLLTLTGLLFGSIVGGAVLVENVFGRPGLGSLTVSAVTNKDMPVVTGLVLVSATAFVLVSGVVALLQPRVDPRLRQRVSA